jgi:hypothetical protein
VTTAAQLTAALGGRWHGWYGTARCVTHDDRSPSLSIVDGQDGPVATCFAGCDWRDVRAELRSRGLLDDALKPRQAARARDFRRNEHIPKPNPYGGRIWVANAQETARDARQSR